METICLSLVRTGSWGYHFQEIPSMLKWIVLGLLVPAFPRKAFASVNCDTVYTIYESLCTQSADANVFRGTAFSLTLSRLGANHKLYLNPKLTYLDLLQSNRDFRSPGGGGWGGILWKGVRWNPLEGGGVESFGSLCGRDSNKNTIFGKCSLWKVIFLFKQSPFHIFECIRSLMSNGRGQWNGGI